MQDKSAVIAIYALTGLVIALWPLWITEKGVVAASGFQFLKSIRSTTALGLAALGVILITGESIASPLILGFGLIALATSMSGGKLDVVAMSTSFLALCVSATLPWWLRQNGSLDISNYKLFAFSLVTFVFIRLFTAHEPIRKSKLPITWIIVYTLFAAILCFSTGIYIDNNAFLTLWHHWGAYVGPAELLLTGATIFHDFPVQYGLGPTTLIASFCGNDCWEGMYFIVSFVTLAFYVLISVMALALSRPRWPERLAVASLCFATCFFWTGDASSVSSPLTYPSGSGLRFLPAVLLTTFLFFANRIEYSKLKILIAHSFWVFSTLWSPESTFYATFVWWPYYLFIRRVQGDFGSRAKGFANATLCLLSISIGLVIIFNIIFRIIYNEGPTLYGFLAYAINPPGAMPINLSGGVWYFLLATVIGMGTLLYSWQKGGDTISFRRGFLVQLLSYAVFSYFLGRSHDNNLLNIMPFLLLVLLNAISATDSKNLSRASIVLTATFLGWLPLFGWQAWTVNIMEGRVLTFDSKLLRDSMSFSSDAERAIDFLHQGYGEPVTVLDSTLDLVDSTPPVAWSAIHGPANFAFIPSQRRQEFLYRTATSLKRSGWLVVDQKFLADEWLTDFDFAYERTNRLKFGSYYAIRFTPKRHD